MMLDSFKFANEDTFFLTFIAAWCSTSQKLWKFPDVTILCMIFTLFFAIILSQIKFCLKTRKKQYSKEVIIPSIFIVAIGQYIANNAINVFSSNDEIVLLGLFVMWILYSCLSVITSQKNLVEAETDSLGSSN